VHKISMWYMFMILQSWRHEVFGKAGTPQTELMNKIEKKVLDRTPNVQWYPCDALITAILIWPSLVTKSAT
jgi:hypothetical protein